MTPADLGRILFGSVLRVVDKKVGVVDELGVSQILSDDLPNRRFDLPSFTR
jgi:hypothetical protein